MINSEQKKAPWYTSGVFMLLALAFLVTSFQGGIWSFMQPTVLSIGSRDIKVDEYKRLISQKKALNFFHQGELENPLDIVKILIDEEILSAELKELGVEIAEQAAVESLHRNPLFMNEEKVFDQKILQRFLRAYGITLKQLIQQEKLRIAIQYLKDCLTAQVFSPSVFTTLMYQGLFQERSGYYKALPFEKISDDKIKNPSAKELRDLYEKQKMIMPARRKYHLLRISPSFLLAKVPVSESQIQEAHALKNKGKKLTPEMRSEILKEIQKKNILEYTESLILKVEDSLGSGKNLKEIAVELDLPFMTLETDVTGLDKNQKIPTQLIFSENEEKSDFFRQQLMQGVFKAHLDTSEIFNLKDETFFIHILQTFPEKTLNFEEAKPMLIQKFKEAKRKEIALTSLKKETKGNWPPSGQYISFTSLNASAKNSAPALVLKALFEINGQGFFLKPSSEIKNRNITDSIKETAYTFDDRMAYAVFLDKVSVPDMKKTMNESEKKELYSFFQKEFQKFLWNTYLNSLQKKYSVNLNMNYFKEPTNES